jgi:hypothetical protein
MKTAEITKAARKFALDEHLSEYPDSATYGEVLEMILEDSEEIVQFEAHRYTTSFLLVETLDNTVSHFERVVSELLKGATP